MLHLDSPCAASRFVGFPRRAGLCVVTLFAVFSLGPNLLAQDAVYSGQTKMASSRQSPAPADQTGAAQAGGRATETSSQATATQQTTQTMELEIVVRGDELPSAYGAPGSFSRSRFSSITQAYVLPPGGVFAGLIYQGDYLPHGPSDNSLTQEIEIGLPYRFGLAIENQVELADSDVSNRNFSIEGRWALADWGKIPLNPTIFAEYKFGTGKILVDEGPPPPPGEEDMAEPDIHALRTFDKLRRGEEDMGEEEEGQPDQPDAYEFRLLLSEEITKNVEWAFNAFLENETSGDRGREWGFAQSIQVPIILPHERLKAGVEMQYTNFTVKDTRGDPEHKFVIGPSFSYKPSARMRFDVAPLIGCTNDSPDLQVFAVFSYVFGGGGGEMGAEAPASTRNR